MKMFFPIMIFTFLLFAFGCKRPDSIYIKHAEKIDVKKAGEIIKEKNDMDSKRILDIDIQYKKKKISLAERNRKIKESMDASEIALEKCRKAKYSIPFKPDWGGREEYLRKVSHSDLMPEGREKNIVRKLENETKKIDLKFGSGQISQSERNKMMKELLDKYKR